MSLTTKKQENTPRENYTLWNILRNLFLTLVALTMGGRIQTLPSGKIRVIFFKWQYFLISILLTGFCLFLVFNQLALNVFRWNNIDPNDDEYIFLPFTSRKVPTKFRHYILNQPSSSVHHPQLYYPRNCPHIHQQQQTSCAKPVPSFIFAGSEFSGGSYVFQKLRQHPQVYNSVDSSNHVTAKHVFDVEDFDEASAFDNYISQFPFLSNISDKKSWIVGENAPHYLYKSHLTAKRIKDILPHVKLVFFLREPIARAYSQYLYEKPEMRDLKLSFEDLIDLELPILRRCGHTSTQTGWEGFFRCHEGSEIRASWKVSNDTHAFNALSKGMYYPALVPFLQNFPTSQLFIMKTEDILQDPSSTFRNLARFLNIDPDFFADSHFYMNNPLTEDILLSKQSTEELSNISALPIHHCQHHHTHHHQYHNQKTDKHKQLQQQQQQFSQNIDEPRLSTRYRLQKVYRHMNNRLVELFDQSTACFEPWVYDVDRG